MWDVFCVFLGLLALGVFWLCLAWIVSKIMDIAWGD
jgi:hypothetical protein